MSIWNNIRRKAGIGPRTRPVVSPADVGLASPDNEWPDTSGALLDTLQAEGTRLLIEQHGRSTAKRPK